MERSRSRIQRLFCATPHWWASVLNLNPRLRASETARLEGRAACCNSSSGNPRYLENKVCSIDGYKPEFPYYFPAPPFYIHIKVFLLAAISWMSGPRDSVSLCAIAILQPPRSSRPVCLLRILRRPQSISRHHSPHCPVSSAGPNAQRIGPFSSDRCAPKWHLNQSSQAVQGQDKSAEQDCTHKERVHGGGEKLP